MGQLDAAERGIVDLRVVKIRGGESSSRRPTRVRTKERLRRGRARRRGDQHDESATKKVEKLFRPACRTPSSPFKTASEKRKMKSRTRPPRSPRNPVKPSKTQ